MGTRPSTDTSFSFRLYGKHDGWSAKYKGNLGSKTLKMEGIFCSYLSEHEIKQDEKAWKYKIPTDILAVNA